MHPLPILLSLLSLTPLTLALSPPHSTDVSEGVHSFLYYSEPRGVADASCPGTPNTLTPWTGAPVKVREVENGSLYTAGDGDDQLYGEAEYLVTFNSISNYIYTFF